MHYPRVAEEIAFYKTYLPNDGKLLEAGCGVGHVVHYWRHQGYDLIGLDYTASGLAVGRAADKEMPLTCGDIHQLPFANDSLASYLSFGVLEHFEHGPLPALVEANRVLRSGGILILSIPYPNRLDQIRKVRSALNLNLFRRNSLLRSLFRKHPAKVKKAAPASNGFYETRYTHRQIAQFVELAGFRVLLQRPIGHSFSWYLFARHFRKRDGYFETTDLCERVAASVKPLAPWSTCFASLTVADKTRDVQ